MECKNCKKDIERTKDREKHKGRYRYRDSKGRVWNGKVCPKCHVDKICSYTYDKPQKQYYKLKHVGKPCSVCKTPLSKGRHKYCSDKCRITQQPRNANIAKKNAYMAEYRKRDVVKERNNVRNKVRRARCKEASLNVPLDDFVALYKKCPEGHQVDHIVPLNHPKVCGLHVPWNMQYLTTEENNKKGNKFDGTQENTEWF